MSNLPLTPMLVQYLVGLCCLRWDSSAVEITIGDMVLDTAAEKERDVDVTVTVAEPGGLTYAFKAYEVKHESAPLDVTIVEQLCLKLLDMPSVTHRAIVSASGFTAGAQAKAANHDVELFALRPWTRPLQEQFSPLAMKGTIEECITFGHVLLYWLQPQLVLVSRNAKGNFTVLPGDCLFAASGQPHSKYPIFADYQRALLLRSTDILFKLDPAATIQLTFPVPFPARDGEIPVGPAWPHTHTLDVARDEVYVSTENGKCRLDYITINGHLQWQRSKYKPVYYVVERVPSNEAFAGAMIAPGPREGQMTCLVFSPKQREVGYHFVRLQEKHLNLIRKLKLELPKRTDHT